MKKTKICKILTIGLCVCALTGCGSKGDTTTDTNQPTINANTGEKDTNDLTENGANDLLDLANMSGSVLEFTDSGCSVSQTTEIEGGAGVMAEAEGYENEDNAVSVKYNSDCEFVIATMNIQSGTITNVAGGSITDVKKNSNVYIYGKFVDTLNFNANKVVITRAE